MAYKGASYIRDLTVHMFLPEARFDLVCVCGVCVCDELVYVRLSRAFPHDILITRSSYDDQIWVRCVKDLG